ncbi:MAG: DNA primase [Planctomycetota bacterium]
MSFRDNGDKEKVQAATDIVRLIGEQVNLRPKGKEFAGLCPFHDDKSPSMQVSPQKQIYKCFSCGAGGDAFSFVMNYHKMGFVEALKYLAERAGIELTPWQGGRGQGDDGSGSGGDRKRIAAANDLAVSFFRALLKHEQHGAEARAYLERRGVSPEMVETFGLGYAPDRWDGLVTMVRDKQWDRDAFEKAQLIRPRKTGDGDFDFLRHRLVFPIFDAIGRPVAFGGRKLRDEDEPKYLNSPETPLFNKSATLYGLHAAKKPIIDSKTAVIVEGYTDVIACHQAGARNVVAALGTALTAEHVRELRRYCEQVILVMDGDAAGQKAADRAVEVFLTGDLDVSIAVLPGGQDPDELLKAGGLDEWEEVLDRAEDALAFVFARTQARLDAADTVTGRQRVAEGFMNQLVELGLTKMGEVRRAFVVGRLAGMLGMSETAVSDQLRQRTPRNRNPRPRHFDSAPEFSEGASGGSRSLETDGQTADSVAPASTGNPEDGGENHDDLGLANGDSRSTLPAVEKAQRRLVAALVRAPSLFQATLDDGSGLDEAVSPADFTPGPTRRLYAEVYHALADGRTPTLAQLLADFAERGEHALIQLATAADHELDQALPPTDVDPETTLDLMRQQLLESANYLIQHRRNAEADRLRQQAMHQPDDQTLHRYLESRRANPSPARVPRPRN